jgi:hypothetical protein
MGLAAKKLRNARRSVDLLEIAIASFSFRSGAEEQVLVRMLPAAEAARRIAAAGDSRETVASQTTRSARAPGSTLRKLRVAPEFPILTHHLQMTVCQQPNRVKLSASTRNRYPSSLFAHALKPRPWTAITTHLTALRTHEQEDMNLSGLCGETPKKLYHRGH